MGKFISADINDREVITVTDYDVIVIGAGVTGCSIARELARFNWRVCVLERNEDVCTGTSKANSGIVHSGIDAHNGTMKARMNMEGNRLMPALSRKLDFAFRQNGSMIVCFEETGTRALRELMDNGIKNGVEGLELLTGDEARAMEPKLSEEVVAAVYAPSGGIVCPFGLTTALAENAAENGVEFRFLSPVEEITPLEGEAGYRIDLCPVAGGVGTAGSGSKVDVSSPDKARSLTTRYVVNAAGVYADVLHNMVSEKKRTIILRRGEYCLFDRSEGGMVDKTIFQLPTRFGKGVLVTPTVHGNLLIGPNAFDSAGKETIDTTAEGLAEIMEKAGKSLTGGEGVAAIPVRKVITSFAGLRAHTEENDFTLEEVSDAPGFFDALGIESPGLTAAPAIGRYMAGLVTARADSDRAAAGEAALAEKTDFRSTRKGILNPENLTMEERNQLIAENPAYGNIICRCEHISEGEILDAIHRPLGAKSLDGVKRRTRAGMGRCQSGFCSPKVLEILARELGVSPEAITKSGPGSEILKGGRI